MKTLWYYRVSDTAAGHTLYPSMRLISCCMVELVSRTEARTFTAAYRELSSRAIATILRATAGPPTYRKAVEAFLGAKARTPAPRTCLFKKLRVKKGGKKLPKSPVDLPKRPIKAAPMVRAVPLRCWLRFLMRTTGVEWSRDVMPICRNHHVNLAVVLSIPAAACWHRCYLFGNEAAVHLVVVLSDLHDGGQGGNSQVDAEWDPFLRDQPERCTLRVWVSVWTHRSALFKVTEEKRNKILIEKRQPQLLYWRH